MKSVAQIVKELNDEATAIRKSGSAPVFAIEFEADVNGKNKTFSYEGFFKSAEVDGQYAKVYYGNTYHKFTAWQLENAEIVA
jgi:hypothetical protein